VDFSRNLDWLMMADERPRGAPPLNISHYWSVRSQTTLSRQMNNPVAAIAVRKSGPSRSEIAYQPPLKACSPGRYKIERARMEGGSAGPAEHTDAALCS
jgi:hypothetical protein